MEIRKYMSNWRVRLGIALIIMAAILYITNFLLFRDLHDTLFYLDIDLAFIPIEALIIVLVLEWIIGEREKRNLLQKMNMVIGSFFSEVGTELLAGISEFDSKTEKIRKKLIMTDEWTKKDFLEASNRIQNYNFHVYIGENNPDSIHYFQELKAFLVKNREFMLRLLANPNLLEHDSFTDLLWAVFHLTEELENRTDLTNLPKADYQHLAGDTERAYSLLVYEWLQYMEHLMENYPYLFSLAIRTNPFNPDATVEIQDPPKGMI
ncbi:MULTISPECIES: hypothetical protein [Methanobacterium]|uniref:Uncharacterized protein n=1 Tax=Methanobacterium bryantii TaxID=2161 RepID=A0A2A2H3V2_METBR|nr:MULTISPECIES: hypothetical protein [Methanobacterium]OEC86796.1 hypothetical protein A9507_10125 [Methanobacterium sp. A39]PAV04072.1 hypothetical protein ASJ80_03395 [Methanobacterium bryantii]